MGANATKMEQGGAKQCQIFCETYGVNEDAYKNAIAAFKKMAGSTSKEMSRKQFTKTLTQKYPEEFADLIFDTFDTDGNGTMSLSEFLVYMGLSSGGSVEQKLQGSFMLFDKDHNGELERSEVIGCFQTLLHSSLYKRYVETHDFKKPKDLVLSDAQKNEIATIVGELFDNLDTDKNGTIDMQEFVNGFKTHPELCQPMMQF